MHKGFPSFEDAKQWLFVQGHDTFHFVEGLSDGPKSRRQTPNDDNRARAEWYVVAKGRVPGIYSTYCAAKLQVDGFPKAVHKAYATEQTARAALESGAGTSGAGDNSRDCERLLDELASMSLESGVVTQATGVR